MTDDSETDEEAVVKSVAVGPTAAAGAVGAKSSVAARPLAPLPLPR